MFPQPETSPAPADWPPRDALIGVGELGRLLGVPEKTIYNWNHKGTGPDRMKVGRGVRYRVGDVLDWLAESRASTGSTRGTEGSDTAGTEGEAANTAAAATTEAAAGPVRFAS